MRVTSSSNFAGRKDAQGTSSTVSASTTPQTWDKGKAKLLSLEESMELKAGKKGRARTASEKPKKVASMHRGRPAPGYTSEPTYL